MVVELIFYMSKNITPQQTVSNCFRSVRVENTSDEEFIQTVTTNNCRVDVRQRVNILFDDYINVVNDLEVCENLSDLNIFKCYFNFNFFWITRIFG